MAQAKETPANCDVANLEFLLHYMGNIGRDDATTRAFFNHLVMDMEHNNIGWYINLPPLKTPETCGYNIPLLARTSISVRSKPLPPLPGRLPLDKPAGDSGSIRPWQGGPPSGTVCGRIITDEVDAPAPATGSKRRRTEPETREPPPHRSTSYHKPSSAQPNIWPTIPRPATITHHNLPHRGSTPSLSTPSPLTNNTGTTTSTTPAMHPNPDFSNTAAEDFIFDESLLPTTSIQFDGTATGGGLGGGLGMMSMDLFSGSWDAADGEDGGMLDPEQLFAGMIQQTTGDGSGGEGFDEEMGRRWLGMMGGGGGGGT